MDATTHGSRTDAEYQWQGIEPADIVIESGGGSLFEGISRLAGDSAAREQLNATLTELAERLAPRSP